MLLTPAISQRECTELEQRSPQTLELQHWQTSLHPSAENLSVFTATFIKPMIKYSMLFPIVALHLHTALQLNELYLLV